MRAASIHALSVFERPSLRAVRVDVYADMLAMLHEYRAECEGLGMPEQVAEIDALLKRAEVV